MVIPEEGITAGHARIPFEDGVSIQTADNGRGRRVLASLLRLSADADKIGEGVSINEEGGVGCESSVTARKVEAYKAMGWVL